MEESLKKSTISLLGIKKRVMLCRFDKVSGVKTLDSQVVFMEAIDAATDTKIDKSKMYHGDLRFDGGRTKRGVWGNSIFMYGEVNFNKPSTIDSIKHFNLIQDNLRSQIHKGFDYDTGHASTFDDKVLMSSCTDPVEWFKYKHCLLGKPERVVVYKVSLADIVEYGV